MDEPSRLARLATEGAVIVGSILLAFWIDAWWDGRQVRIAEAEALESVRVEAEQNRVSLDGAIITNENRLARLDFFIRATPAELRDVSSDSVAPLVSALSMALTYDPDLSATRLFLDGGTAVTPVGREVRKAAARWIRQLDDASEEREALFRVGEDLNFGLSRLALEAGPEGVGFLSAMVGNSGGEGIAVLRSDSDFMATVVKKVHYQTGYLTELQQASDFLDALREKLR